MNDEATPSARARVLECEEAIGVISERLAEAETELAGMGLRDAKRHTLRRKIAEMRADLDDAQAQKAKLAPAVREEHAAERHAHAVAEHKRAMLAAEQATWMPASMDKVVAEFCKLHATYAEWWPRCAAVAGVNPNPLHLNARMPTREAFAEVLLAKLVAAGVLDMEHLPQRYQDEPIFRDELRRAGLAWPGDTPRTPLEWAAEASFVRDVHMPFVAAVRAADPDRQQREQARVAEIARQRAEREAAEMTKPLRKEPAPEPMVHSPAIVIGR